jgi:hypothetical protein
MQREGASMDWQSSIYISKRDEEVRSLEEIYKKPFGEFKNVNSLQDDKY